MRRWFHPHDVQADDHQAAGIDDDGPQDHDDEAAGNDHYQAAVDHDDEAAGPADDQGSRPWM